MRRVIFYNNYLHGKWPTGTTLLLTMDYIIHIVITILTERTNCSSKPDSIQFYLYMRANVFRKAQLPFSFSRFQILTVVNVATNEQLQVRMYSPLMY